VAIVQYGGMRTEATTTTERSPLKGLVAVLATCMTAGFSGERLGRAMTRAGVYFEKMLKDGSSCPFWVRNLQMYTCGIVSAGLSMLVTEGSSVAEHGLFYNFDGTVVALTGASPPPSTQWAALLALGGIYISLVMKHLDNMHKAFAQAFVIVLVFIVSHQLFGTPINASFALGVVVVVASTAMYNTFKE